MSVRCLGCGQCFDGLAALKRHEQHRDHRDVGEVWV